MLGRAPAFVALPTMQLLGLHDYLHSNERGTTRRAQLNRRPFAFKAGALLRGLVALDL
jgi:hypothetical protein